MAFSSKLAQVAARCISPVRAGSPTRLLCASPTRALSPNRALSPQRFLSASQRTGSPQRFFSPIRSESPSRLLSPTRTDLSNRLLIPPHTVSRFMSSCRKYPDPPCPPPVERKETKTCPGASTTPSCGERFAHDPCRKPAKKVSKKKEPEFKSMWNYPPECCNQVCPNLVPRFDAMYYKPSDKAKRKYMQTWTECPEMMILPRKVCCFEKLDKQVIPIERRERKHKPKTACSQLEDLRLGMSCSKIQGKYSRCKKIVMPGCRGARSNPRCIVARKVSKCKKICTPYPSFSECIRAKPKPRPKVECSCLRIPTMCDVWEEMHRQMKLREGGSRC